MAVKRLELADFMARVEAGVLLDVRSPAEHAQGHIPEALSFPLFDAEERARVGTAYKQESPERALELGLELVGPKLASFVQKATTLSAGKPLFLYCWRGGQRSASLAWLLDFAGLEVYVLQGGYKRWRQELVRLCTQDWHFRVVGGRTGSGKTELLQLMEAHGEQVIDLEAIALHKGSSFGARAGLEQPSTEHFGNLLCVRLRQLDRCRIVWLEDESRMIGTVHLPDEFYKKLRQSPLLIIEVPLKQRIHRLVSEYGAASDEVLKAAFERIRKKLGGQHLQAAFEALDADDRAAAAAIALRYYDKAYNFDLETKDTDLILYFDATGLTMEELAVVLPEFSQKQLSDKWKTNG